MRSGQRFSPATSVLSSYSGRPRPSAIDSSSITHSPQADRSASRLRSVAGITARPAANETSASSPSISPIRPGKPSPAWSSIDGSLNRGQRSTTLPRCVAGNSGASCGCNPQSETITFRKPLDARRRANSTECGSNRALNPYSPLQSARSSVFRTMTGMARDTHAAASRKTAGRVTTTIRFFSRAIRSERSIKRAQITQCSGQRTIA